jgi:hypothetical protein
LDIFACGAIKYLDHYADNSDVRIVIPIYFGNQSLPIPAVVDTGAPWCVLDPILIEKLGSDVEQLQPVHSPLNIRGIAYFGWLYRVPMSLEASLGAGLEIEATAFVPDLLAGETWSFPNFIGLEGFLNRIRFAVDPATNLFFFGPLNNHQ